MSVAMESDMIIDNANNMDTPNDIPMMESENESIGQEEKMDEEKLEGAEEGPPPAAAVGGGEAEKGPEEIEDEGDHDEELLEYIDDDEVTTGQEPDVEPQAIDESGVSDGELDYVTVAEVAEGEQDVEQDTTDEQADKPQEEGAVNEEDKPAEAEEQAGDVPLTDEGTTVQTVSQDTDANDTSELPLIVEGNEGEDDEQEDVGQEEEEEGLEPAKKEEEEEEVEEQREDETTILSIAPSHDTEAVTEKEEPIEQEATRPEGKEETRNAEHVEETSKPSIEFETLTKKSHPNKVTSNKTTTEAVPIILETDSSRCFLISVPEQLSEDHLPVLYQDKGDSLLNSNLDALFNLIRETDVLRDDYKPEQELVITMEQLQLSIAEDNFYVNQVTLLDLVNLKLKQNKKERRELDDFELDQISLILKLSCKDRFITQFNKLCSEESVVTPPRDENEQHEEKEEELLDDTTAEVGFVTAIMDNEDLQNDVQDEDEDDILEEIDDEDDENAETDNNAGTKHHLDDADDIRDEQEQEVSKKIKTA